MEIAWTPRIVDRVRGSGRTSGAGDVTVGARCSLSDPDRDGPQLSVQGFVSAPTATHGLGAGGWAGGARLPASLPLSGGLSLSLSPEADVARNTGGGGTHLAWSLTAGLGRSFGPTTLGLELWRMEDRDPAGHAHQTSIDLTAAEAIGANLQLDAGVNLGLDRDTPDAEVYAGISRRF